MVDVFRRKRCPYCGIRTKGGACSSHKALVAAETVANKPLTEVEMVEASTHPAPTYVAEPPQPGDESGTPDAATLRVVAHAMRLEGLYTGSRICDKAATKADDGRG